MSTAHPLPEHPSQTTTAQVIHLPLADFEELLTHFYEREDQLFRRVEGEKYPHKELVDLYTISGHAEALLSQEIDGDLWATLEDLEETAQTEEEAWDKIRRFYLERGYVLLVLDEGEEWIFAPEVLQVLGI